MSETNPYLKDPIMRNKLIEPSAVTSYVVEDITIDLNKPSEPAELKRK